jgi:SAM-dependent methyltransferase
LDFFEKLSGKIEAPGYECPLCACADSSPAYRFSMNNCASKIYHCCRCDFLFCRPIQLTNLHERQMDSIDDAELFNAGLLKKLHEKLIIGKEIRTVRGILGTGEHSLLDIGCGTGWTTNIWKRNGFNVTGLEPSEARRTIAWNAYGISMLPNYIEELDSNHTYDVIILRHVLEHLEDPLAMVRKIRSLLRKNGLFVLVVPNINCLGRYIFETKWSWILPFHCNFFTPRSIRELASVSEFEVCSQYQTPSPLWYPESFARLLPENGSSLTRRIYERLNIFSMLPFAPLVGIGHLLGLSDNLTLVARVKD